jgi:hypothetical protein
MAGILDFQQYIGGADQIKIEQAFPSDQKQLNYNFGVNVTGWTFSADYQTLVVDQITFNRYTGQPNFTNSRVIGSFSAQDLTGDDAPAVLNATTGVVALKIPAGMYDGPIIPDARENVPIVVVAFTWTNAEAYPQTNTHRWAFIQCWEPDVAVGDPTESTSYVPLVEAQ